MRDLILAAILFGALPLIVWRPTLGVFMWVWVSVMNPHRMAFGFAYDFAFGQLIAIATFIGMFFSKDPKRLPVTPVTVTLLLLLVWISISTFFALDVTESLKSWEKVMKIQLMVFVALYLLHSKQHIQVLVAIVTLSVAFFGVKGGVFTLLGGGENRVWGPPGSYIEENNSLALATIMTIPLLYYLYLQTKKRWQRWGLLATMLLCGFSALGSYSRGGFIAIGVMAAFLWAKSRSRAATGFVLLLLVPIAIGFMPEKWEERMWSIQEYEQDASSMGRINAWKMAINLANDRPLTGGGFDIYNEKVFGRYAPVPDDVHAAHSIYFTMLGEHGYVGLLLFLILWRLVWKDAAFIIRSVQGRKDLQWASDLARMIQVALVGYAVGGAFLSLAYFDVPYNLLAALVLTRLLVEKELKEAEPTKAGAPSPAAGDGQALPQGAAPGPGFEPQAQLREQVRSDRFGT